MRPVEQVIFDGQSLNNSPANGITYPLQTFRLLPAGRTSMHMAGVSGTTYAQRTAGGVGFASVVNRVDVFHKNAYRSTIVDAGGSSDILAGLTAAQLVTTVQAYVAARKAAGATYVVGLTVTPSTLLNAAQETIRGEYNTLLRAGGIYDALVDVAAIPQLQNASDALYYSDGSHWTELGASYAAASANSTLRTLLAL